MRTACATFAVLVGLSASGCGLADPYTEHRARPATSGHRKPAPSDARVRASAGSAGPRARRLVLRDFATAATTWSWRSRLVALRQQRALAAGALRAALDDDGREVRGDAELRRQRITSRGRVLAIDATDPDAAYVVVRETQRTQGIASIGETTLRVYGARLVPTARGWRVAGWTVAG